MADIIRMVLKGSSGYCCVDNAFNDKVTITLESISYEYIPVMETEINPKRKWSYKTTSPIFKEMYSGIANMIPRIIENDINKCEEKKMNRCAFIKTFVEVLKYGKCMTNYE